MRVSVKQFMYWCVFCVFLALSLSAASIDQIYEELMKDPAFQSADREMSRVYGFVRSKLDSEKQAVLREAQRKWLADRDRGLLSARPGERAAVALAETRARTEFLSVYPAKSEAEYAARKAAHGPRLEVADALSASRLNNVIANAPVPAPATAVVGGSSPVGYGEPERVPGMAGKLGKAWIPRFFGEPERVPGMAGKRVALVVGCSTYKWLPSSMQLVSPAADSADVATALKAMGYLIVGGGPVKDPTRDEFATAAERFAIAARGAEAAVLYYSGHGVQVGDDNYLLPVDTPKITGVSQLKNRAVQLRDSFMVALEESKVPTKVVVLDCCRDNPFAAELEVVMGQVGKSIKTKSVGELTGYGPGFYLAFATSPGRAALDGNGSRNSPFTTAFLRTLRTSSGKDIDLFFRDVKRMMPADQVSWTNSSLTDEFALGFSATSFRREDSVAQPTKGGQ